MEKEFQTEIKSPLSHGFEIEEDGLYTITIKASCKPGWRNKWWLKLKGIIEDILDLHLDDEDLRVEIDGTVFRKPKGKKGLFNSPAAFSGTKTLGKTKTVVFIIHLSKGSHTIKFIPDGSPFLVGREAGSRPAVKNIEVEKVNNPRKTIFYLNLRAENENYYSWYTMVLINQSLKTISIVAQAGILGGEKDDDDLKILIDGEVQKNPQNSHQDSYFCGFTLKGKEDVFIKDLNLQKDIHYLELFADKKPILKIIKLVIEKENGLPISDPMKTKDTFNPQYIMKDSAFLDSDSMDEKEIENFLQKEGKDFPNHLVNRVFEGEKPSFFIKKYTREYQINPEIILTKLQAEKGLIRGDNSVNPAQAQLDYALGVGCPANRPCDPKFNGFVIQIKAACQTFRNNFERAEASNFEVEVEGKLLKAINKATFSILQYSPFITSARLFYDVYQGFFTREDLGGETKNKSTTGVKTAIFLVIFFLVFGWTTVPQTPKVIDYQKTESINSQPREDNKQSERVLGTVIEHPIDHSRTFFLSSEYKLEIDLRIKGLKKLKPQEYWCGAPFLIEYQEEAKAKIKNKNDLILDEINLTSATLVLGPPFNSDFYFYEIHDLDGDGKKEELALFTYFSCNGNFLQVIKVDKEKGGFVNIPFHLGESVEEKIFVGPTREYFNFNNGQLWIKSYDMFVGKFYKNMFKFQNGVFERVSKTEESL